MVAIHAVLVRFRPRWVLQALCRVLIALLAPIRLLKAHHRPQLALGAQLALGVL